MSVKILIVYMCLMTFCLAQIDSIGAEWNPTGNPIGGGPGYSDSVRHQEAHYVVATKAELINALNSANSGEVVYIADSVEIDMTGTVDTVKAGVTLASGRGRTLSDTISWGALLYNYNPEYSGSYKMLLVEDNARITGIRFRGSYSTYDMPRDTSIHFPHTNKNGNREVAICSYRGDSVEIDNCEFLGWGYTPVLITGLVTDTVWGCSIHHCHLYGGGHVYMQYPFLVQLYGGDLLIEACYSDFSNGLDRCAAENFHSHSCEIRYCIQGKHSITHVCDGHGGADTTATIYVHHNTIQNRSKTCSGGCTGVVIRQPVPDTIFIHNNWFWTPESTNAVQYCIDVHRIRIYNNSFDSIAPVGVAGRIPNAQITVIDGGSGVPPCTVKFKATGSQTLTSNLRAFYWWFGDSADTDNWRRSTNINDTITHIFGEVGKYRVRLRVTNDLGACAYDEVDINVRPDDGRNYLSCWIADRWHDDNEDTLYKRIYIGRQSQSDTHWLVYDKDICYDGGWEHVIVDITDSLTDWRDNDGEDSIKITFMLYAKSGWIDMEWNSSGATPYMMIDDVVIYGANVRNGNFEENPTAWYDYGGSEYLRSDNIWIPFRKGGGSGWRCIETTGLVNSGDYGYYFRWGNSNPNWNAGEYAAVKQTVAIIDVVDPQSPYIYSEKSGENVDLIWNKVLTDELNNPEAVDYYVVYRDTIPDFVPSSLDSIGYVIHPDTEFTDTGVLNSLHNFYYLVRAVDWAKNKSKKSNMGYVLDRFFNYNTDRSSRNWASLPWHNEYSTVSDLVADLSPAGDPLEAVSNLRDDQIVETWLWDTDFMTWFGPNNFAIEPGRAYEMVAIRDYTLMLVGSNNPDGLISLNHNTDRSSRNWVPIPYNAVYNTVDDIAQEYSPAGDPLESITNLRDDQVVETWLWDTDFMMWFGPNDFAIEPGRGYEFVPIKDTTWNPNEYTNEAFIQVLARRGVKRPDVEVYGGQSLEPDRAPVWTVKKSDKRIDYSDSKAYTLVTKRSDEKANYREPGVSHIVRVHLSVKKFNNLVFTAYRPELPNDVLTENMISSCVAIKGDQAALWFNVANFKRPWQDKEEVIIIIEALNQGKGYFTSVNVILDERVDVQDVKHNITLMPIPEPLIAKGSISWHRVDNNNIVGYSLYERDKRINERVLKQGCFAVDGDVNLRPVIRGGYETVYCSQNHQSMPNDDLPISYVFNIYPNLFAKKTSVHYAIPHPTLVDIKVYDVSGRRVKSLISERHEPGYYQIDWLGDDDMGRKVAAGIYFIRIDAKEFESHNKVVFLY